VDCVGRGNIVLRPYFRVTIRGFHSKGEEAYNRAIKKSADLSCFFGAACFVGTSQDLTDREHAGAKLIATL
jgi:hypothetical protein